LVVQGQIGLRQRDGVEGWVAEVQGRGARSETSLVAQDVLDILGADVAGVHDLVNGTAGGGVAKQLDQEGQAHAFSAKRARASSQDFEVVDADSAEADQAGRQLVWLAARLLGQGGLAMGGELVVLVGVPAARMRGDALGSEEDGHVVVGAAHEDALVHQMRWHRVETMWRAT
jgi:hypothetical protein